MLLRAGFLLCLLCLGCQSAITSEPEPPPVTQNRIEDEPAAAAPGTAAREPAILSPPKLTFDPRTGSAKPPEPGLPNHLNLAAGHLAHEDDATACEHMAAFVADHPDHRNGRFLYAELLYRLARYSEARPQYEDTIGREQAAFEVDLASLIHCHARLAAIAEVSDKEFDIHLHRGIGLYWLAQARAKLDEPSGDLCVETLLCKAASELATAHALQSEHARPMWYLHRVWLQLGQTALARRWLLAAWGKRGVEELTPSERRELHLMSERAITGLRLSH